jgi:ELWxxDGT repeat protein
MVRDIDPRADMSSNPSDLTCVGNTLFFAATEETNGAELWKTDGTELGTELVRDIRVGPFGGVGGGLFDFNGTLFFSASNGLDGFELWKSDGTKAGTVLVLNIAEQTLRRPR